MSKRNQPPVICPYCGKEAELTTGKEVYPHRKDIHSLNFWVCRKCEAYVGCHKKGTYSEKGSHKSGKVPLGTLAKVELRRLRIDAHRYFDPIWKEGPSTRKTAYALLAGSLEIPVEKCHISQFTIEQCEKTIRICKKTKFNKQFLP